MKSFIALLSILSVLFAVTFAAPIVAPTDRVSSAGKKQIPPLITRPVSAREPSPEPLYLPVTESTGDGASRLADYNALDTRANNQEIQNFLESLFTVDGLKKLFGREEVDEDIIELARRRNLFDLSKIKPTNIDSRGATEDKRALTSADLSHLFTLDTLKEILGIRAEIESRALSGGDIAGLNQLFSLDGLKKLLSLRDEMERRALSGGDIAELNKIFSLDGLKKLLGLRAEVERRALSGGDIAELNKIFSLDGLKKLLGLRAELEARAKLLSFDIDLDQ